MSKSQTIFMVINHRSLRIGDVYYDVVNGRFQKRNRYDDSGGHAGTSQYSVATALKDTPLAAYGNSSIQWVRVTRCQFMAFCRKNGLTGPALPK